VTDTAAILTTSLAGRHLTDVKRREYDWAFGFGANVSVQVSCPWRILVEDRIALTNSDDGQKFGLPAPVDGEDETRRLLAEKSIQRVAIRLDTGDLSVVFNCNTVLEVLNMSSGYEVGSSARRI
jgi:hypothetical protein